MFFGDTKVVITKEDVMNLPEKAQRFFDGDKTVILNSNFQEFQYMSWRDAFSMVYVGKAEIVSMRDRGVHPEMMMPLVIRLKDLRKFYKTHVEWGKTAVHIRDEWTCQYCGEKVTKDSATIDHVIPKAQGGQNGWLNTVCSCFPCNNAKEDRTPSQAGMTLIRQPYQPTIAEFYYKDIANSGGVHLVQLTWQKMGV